MMVFRSWNVSNNALYLKSIQENKLPNEIEILSITDRYNEYIMTGLRPFGFLWIELKPNMEWNI
jgi:hypothetical protein